VECGEEEERRARGRWRREVGSLPILGGLVVRLVVYTICLVCCWLGMEFGALVFFCGCNWLGFVVTGPPSSFAIVWFKLLAGKFGKKLIRRAVSTFGAIVIVDNPCQLGTGGCIGAVSVLKFRLSSADARHCRKTCRPLVSRHGHSISLRRYSPFNGTDEMTGRRVLGLSAEHALLFTRNGSGVNPSGSASVLRPLNFVALSTARRHSRGVWPFFEGN